MFYHHEKRPVFDFHLADGETFVGMLNSAVWPNLACNGRYLSK